MAHSFSEGLAAVQIGKKWGFIDKTGNVVIPPQLEIASHFSEGLALAVRNQIWIAIQQRERDQRCQNLPPNLCQ
ncbi:WG repeat-containing protein [Leptospira weilii]|uniref:WG repeat-containing protein n=1 Tax=Leptospira weilii TaxID=28184 RepID=UPI0009BF471A|nr:WG repeat-containing protein [Leptospira weilii]